jgi:hypothetical protein
MRYESSVKLSAPPEWVWTWFEDDANFAVIHPGVLDHRVTQSLPGGGHNCVQVVPCEQHGSHEVVMRCLAYEPPFRVQHRGESNDGGVQLATRLCERNGRGTLLRRRVEIKVLPREMARRGSRKLLTAFFLARSQERLNVLGAAIDAAFEVDGGNTTARE